MTPEEKLLHLFTLEHGEVTGSCSTEVVYDDDTYEPIAVALIKDGMECWRASRESLLYAYVTRNL
jgi:hypothetical protein